MERQSDQRIRPNRAETADLTGADDRAPVDIGIVADANRGAEFHPSRNGAPPAQAHASPDPWRTDEGVAITELGRDQAQVVFDSFGHEFFDLRHYPLLLDRTDPQRRK